MLENKLIQELGEEIYIITSNTAQSKIISFIKFIWGELHQLELPFTSIKTGTEFFIALLCHRLPHKK